MLGYVMVITFMWCFLAAKGQSFHSLIVNDTVLQNICKKLPKYDSILVYSQSSYWNANPILRGIGFKAGEPYLLCIEYSAPFSVENNKHPYFKEERIEYELLELLLSNGVETIEQDSLNIVSCPQQKYTLHISDGEYITIIKLYPKRISITHLQSYKPTSYQSYCPNAHRARFIELFNNLAKVSPANEGCQPKE